MPLAQGYYIYRHIRPSDGTPFYIGRGRFRKDRNPIPERAQSKTSRNIYWQRIAEKEGGFNFEIMLDGMSREEADQKEKEFIRLYGKAKDGGMLANITDGGEGGQTIFEFTEEYRKIMSERVKGEKHPNYGRKLKPETIKKKSEAITGIKHYLYGKKLTEDWKNNIRKSKIGKNNPMYGKTGFNHPMGKPVINLENGIFYGSVQEAAKAHNVNPKTLYQYLDGTKKNKTMLMRVN